MSPAPLMAFLHHLAAFAVVGTLLGEVLLLRPPLTVEQARRLLRLDAVFGLSAAAVLVVGLLRVQYFEKGPAYYWHDLFFLIKLGAFLLAALLSIYPTVVFLSWRGGLRRNEPPQIAPERLQRMRRCMMLELTAIVVILACAAWMARGFGYLGR